MASIRPARPILLRHFTLDLASIQPSAPTLRDHFSLDFLPGGGGGGAWEIADSCGGLLLLYRGAQLYSQLGSSSAGSAGRNPGLVVCEPLARRYKPIPCPQDLGRDHQYLGLFLLDGGDDDDPIGMSNFRVVAALLRPHVCDPGRGVPVAYVFATASDMQLGAWSGVFPSGRSDGDWHLVKRAWTSEIDVPGTIESFYFAGRARGSFYWGVKGTGGGEQALVLESRRGHRGILVGHAPGRYGWIVVRYDLPVRPATPTNLPVRPVIAAEDDDSSARNNGAVAMARTCAARPGLLILSGWT